SPSIAPRTALRSRTSSGSGRTRSLPSSPASASSRSRRRPTATIRAWSWAKRRAIAVPNPAVAPVTRTIIGFPPLAWLVERQNQRLEIGAFRKARVNRMIGSGARRAQDPARPPGIEQPAPHGLGEVGFGDIVRAGRHEEIAAGLDERGREARHLAI